MSTKTSIKRIAAVAAVALTLGGFSAVSAHATTPNYLQAGVTTVSSLTSSPVAGSEVDGLITYTGLCTGVAYSYIATQASFAALPILSDGALPSIRGFGYNDTSTATTTAYTVSTYGGSAILPSGTYVHDHSNDANFQTTNQNAAFDCGTSQGTFRAYAKIAFTPSVAGTYVINLVDPDRVTWNSPQWTVNVAAAATVNVASSTAYELAANSNTASDYTLASDITGYATAAKAAGNLAGAIAVTQSNGLAAGTAGALLAGGKLTVTVSGSGLAYATDVSSSCAFSNAVRAMTGTSTALTQKICFYSDGTAGLGTVSWSVGTVALGSSIATFYGSPAKYAATVVHSVIEPNGTITASTASNVSNSNRKAVKVKVTDANGNIVVGAKVYMNSDNTSVISGSYQADKYAGSDSYGYAYFDLTGVTAGTANLSFTNKSSVNDPAITATNPEITAGPVAVRVGSTKPDSVTVTFDAATYVPGQTAVVTVKVLDSNGLPVARGAYSVFNSALTSNLALTTGSTPGTAATASCVDAYGVPGTSAAATCATGFTQSSPVLASGQVWIPGDDGTATYTVNMPISAGVVTLTGTISTYLPNGLGTSVNAGAAISASATVGAGAAGDAAQAAVDAANEATDAANAATDAANNAMDSADAAQQAAMDAGDKADAALAAVTDLATKVSEIATQIQSLSAVVAKIAAAVAKISAKVKA